MPRTPVPASPTTCTLCSKGCSTTAWLKAKPEWAKGARLIRDNKVMPVDVYAVLKEGAVEQNVWLAANDTLFIPSQNDLKAYVVGEVGTPGAVSFGTGDLTLTRALALTPATPAIPDPSPNVIASTHSVRIPIALAMALLPEEYPVVQTLFPALGARRLVCRRGLAVAGGVLPRAHVVGPLREQQVGPVGALAEEHQYGAGPGTGVLGRGRSGR